MFLGPGTRADQRDPRDRSTPRRPPRRGVPQSGVLGRPGPIPVGTRRAGAPVSMSRPVIRRRGRDPTAVLIPAGGLPRYALRAGELGTDPSRRELEEAATLPPSRGRKARCGRGFRVCAWVSRSEDPRNADSLGPGHAAPSGDSRRSGTWRTRIEDGEVARGNRGTRPRRSPTTYDQRPTVSSIERCWVWGSDSARARVCPTTAGISSVHDAGRSRGLSLAPVVEKQGAEWAAGSTAGGAPSKVRISDNPIARFESAVSVGNLTYRTKKPAKQQVHVT